MRIQTIVHFYKIKQEEVDTIPAWKYRVNVEGNKDAKKLMIPEFRK